MDVPVENWEQSREPVSQDLRSYAGPACILASRPQQKCPANTIPFVISQLHFHDLASRFHFSTQNENVSECSSFPACRFYEDSELEYIVLLNHNRK